MTYLPKIRYLTPAYKNMIMDDNAYHPIIRGRMVDMYWIMKHMDLPSNALILEFGAWPCDNWRLALQRWTNLQITDSFGWLNGRTLPGTPTRAEWEAPLVGFGIPTYELDVQTLDVLERYDGIYSISVLEHVINDETGLKNIYNALVPGGWFVFTVEMNPYVGMEYDNDIWFRVYKQDYLVDMLHQVGFEVNGDAEAHEDFDEQFKAAIGAPHLLRLPYKHFVSAGVAARKPL